MQVSPESACLNRALGLSNRKIEQSLQIFQSWEKVVISECKIKLVKQAIPIVDHLFLA